MTLLRSIELCPLAGLRVIRGAILFVQIRGLWHERVIWIRIREQRQNAQEHLRDAERGAPLTLQNIKTDAARCVDIRMVDFGAEGDNRRLERILRRETDVQVEESTLIGRIRRAEDHGLPGEEVCLAHGASRAARGGILLKFGVFTL